MPLGKPQRANSVNDLIANFEQKSATPSDSDNSLGKSQSARSTRASSRNNPMGSRPNSARVPSYLQPTASS